MQPRPSCGTGHGLTVLVRNALWAARPPLRRRGDSHARRARPALWHGERRWRDVLERFHETHGEVLLDGDARSTAYFIVDETDELTDHVWHVTQIFHDADGDNDFRIVADVDLDATQDEGEVVFKGYRAGSIEDLAE